MSGLEGLRVLSLESRNAAQMARLIENQGGTAISAPSMREVPLKENPAALAFADDLIAGKIDLVIFLTGVGTRILFSAMETRYPRQQLVEALSRLPIAVRGPKPAAVLREFSVPIAIVVPEPNTWRDILKVIDEHEPPLALKGKQVAIQEYGVTNRELMEQFEARGASVTLVPVYQWALPEDIEPLRRAIMEIIEEKIDVLLVTSANQIHHLMQVASQNGLEDQVRQGFQSIVAASIGPIASEALREYGIEVDLEPLHPKMGQLVHETAERAGSLLQRKRRIAGQRN